MSDAIVSRLGEKVGGAADPNELFLKTFAGEVLTAFETKVKLKDKHRTRGISVGQSAQFPATFKASARYHVPGTEINGQVIPHSEVTITLDDLLISDVFVAKIDELKNHYDVRAPYSKELGDALALFYDKNVCRNLVLASRGAELFTGDGGGTSLAADGFATDAATLIDGFSDAVQAMEERDVPIEDYPVYAAVKPAQWYLLANYDKNVNKDYNSEGDIKSLKVTTLAGVNVVKSNAFPFGVNDSANSAIPAKYRADFTKTRSVVWIEAAAATLQLMGLSFEEGWDMRRQGTLMLAKMAVGHGTLRTKCGVELKVVT
jgi:hypothetical protein